ncbi:sporulation histidine kinase inhibitor Sda [Mangrovibacillus cuniculi]|uniref:Sporulation histidine kinase inhibitor Sda n=1 Tax=Mangrovibacillus cuniculi TaxID=2593652 RepID=A0A7S8CBJ4_9BACI|nr:sporulation histidine kinase inhibitor Sda [Mangrovibacillus cuniculi]QPC46960.1 sporulation histidine kinase inhibitor Sda [Mangrovibacillus cuniculi]
MSKLSNELLLESYYKAVDLRLHEDFIALIRQEIERRSLHLVAKSS